MDKVELLIERKMDYHTLVSHLLKKYGPAKYDYFPNPECRAKNKKVTRTKEGLFCHHIDEEREDGLNLSDPGFARLQPFEYQRADRLVYANYIEHLLLHICIAKKQFCDNHEDFSYPKDIYEFFNLGIIYICQEMNDLYVNNGSKQVWRDCCYRMVAENYAEYLAILNDYLKFIDNLYAGKRDLDYENHKIRIGRRVKHKTLGIGEVIDIQNNYIGTTIVIKFESVIKRESGEKFFCYEAGLEELKRKLSNGYEKEYPSILAELISNTIPELG